MAATANLVERAMGHSHEADIHTDISSYNNEFGTETGEKIRAAIWKGKNDVGIGAS
jgi:hypothetical protein